MRGIRTRVGYDLESTTGLTSIHVDYRTFRAPWTRLFALLLGLLPLVPILLSKSFDDRLSLLDVVHVVDLQTIAVHEVLVPSEALVVFVVGLRLELRGFLVGHDDENVEQGGLKYRTSLKGTVTVE